MAERTWYEIENIPSGGIAYPKDWKISICAYSYGDVLNLSKAAERGLAAFDKVLDGVKCNFDKRLLLPTDILYLGLYRRLVSTKHTQIELRVECPACAKQNNKVMDLKDVPFKELRVPALPIIAELSTGTLEFMPITYEKFKEVYKKYDSDPSWLVAYSVSNMKPEEARSIILEACSEDKEVIEEVTDLLDFGLEPVEFECCDDFCTHTLKVQLESPETLCFPFRKPDESAKSRIKFGNESHS